MKRATPATITPLRNEAGFLSKLQKACTWPVRSLLPSSPFPLANLNKPSRQHVEDHLATFNVPMATACRRLSMGLSSALSNWWQWWWGAASVTLLYPSSPAWEAHPLHFLTKHDTNKVHDQAQKMSFTIGIALEDKSICTIFPTKTRNGRTAVLPFCWKTSTLILPSILPNSAWQTGSKAVVPLW